MMNSAAIGLLMTCQQLLAATVSERDSLGDPASFTVSVSETQSLIRSDGRMLWPGRSVTRSLKLPVDDGHITNLYAASVGDGDLLLVLQLDDYEAGWSKAVRLRRRLPHLVWASSMLGLNAAPPCINGSDAYLAASGFIAKLNINGGKYKWRHAGMYESDKRLNMFDQPELRGSTVIFRAQALPSDTQVVITVERASGRILSVK